MKIAVCCHDAGGSEVVAAWVAANPQNHYSFILKGPSIKIFDRVCDLTENSSSIPPDSDLVLTSTSWASEHELECIKDAKKQGIKSASYIDHWVNYRERFAYPNSNWEENLPDEIWYGDEYAHDILLDTGFPDVMLKYVENEYFNSLKEKMSKSIVSKYKYLYVCEPIADHMFDKYGDSLYLGYDEYTAIDHFFRIVISSSDRILIRLHPSESKKKYNSIIHKYNAILKIDISENTTLFDDIENSKIVVGCESMAMVIALMAGKKVYTSIPLGRDMCRLPFVEIRKLGTLLYNE